MTACTFTTDSVTMTISTTGQGSNAFLVEIKRYTNPYSTTNVPVTTLLTNAAGT